MYPDEPFTIGIDIGATKVLIGSVTQEGKVVHQQRYDIDLSSEQLLRSSIYDSIANYIDLQQVRNVSKTIGIGVFGHVDFEHGEWMGSMRLPGMDKVRFREDLQAKYGFDIAVDNDVHAATLAEMYLGKGRQYRNFLYVNVGTGIAAGIVSDGRLVRGAANYAGEIGHIFVGKDMEPCMCGSNWCLETAASGGGMIHRANRWLMDYPDSILASKIQSGTVVSVDIFRAALLGDPLAGKIHQEFIWSMGIVLVNLVNILNPEAIIMGGGVLQDEWLMKELSTFVFEHAAKVPSNALKEITLTELGPQVVGLLGASCLAWNYEAMN
ncbi:ROK family protein [Paenibacillus anaericanus]|uniref:ROK family protein n=1 Tax=Paenibacillus anaericanus TaxID=170367 RepID=A0A3S1BT30_9BACL|nr:ROK family protein [Paenibacillus anaericanus]RUT46771.1 ROK family protein [Paenibacillus anaericanus]